MAQRLQATELAAILVALTQANPAEALILLVDSTAATMIRRLSRFRSREFRPTWEGCTDADIISDILDQLTLRADSQGATIFVLVRGHGEEVLHWLRVALE
jgi:hypothetical protein